MTRREPPVPIPARPKSRMARSNRTTHIARAGVIAAVYASLTLLTILFLQGLAWGPVQFRISEAVTVVACLTSSAVPGLTIGCIIANALAISMAGTGLSGLFDVVFGSFATFLGALWCRKFRKNTKVALLGPVICNALIVPAYLPFIVQAYGFYTIPFTDISGYLLPMYPSRLATESRSVVVYCLGPLFLARCAVFGVLSDE